jgi:flagellar motor switch protein FliG
MDLNKLRSQAYKKVLPGDSEGPKQPVPASEDPTDKPVSQSEDGLVKETAKPGPQKMALAMGMPLKPGQKPPNRREIAQYLVIVGQERASQILRHLPEEAVEAIVQEIAQLPRVDAETRRQVLERFSGLGFIAQTHAQGGVETARGFLVKAFGPERGEQILRKSVPEEVHRHFQFLEEYSPQQIQTLLKQEGPALKVLVLSHLSPKLSAGVIGFYSREEQLEIIRRLSRIEKLDREVLLSIEQALKERIRKQGTTQSAELDGKGVLAEILKHMQPGSEAPLIEYLEDQDPELAVDIKERLFTIDTLLHIDDKDLQKVLQDRDDRQIALILKGKREEIRKKILTNVSQARAGIIIEEFQHMGARRRSEIDESTRDFVRYLRSLEEKGELVVRRGGDEYI